MTGTNGGRRVGSTKARKKVLGAWEEETGRQVMRVEELIVRKGRNSGFCLPVRFPGGN